MFKIQQAKTADIELIRKLAHQIWPPTFERILSAEQMSYMLEMMYSQASLQQQQEEGVVFLMAKEGEKPIGFAGIQPNYQGKPKTKIHKLYLLPETQGKGYGKKLMNYITEMAREKGDNTLSLNVNRFNKAYDFYLKTGFQKVGEEDIDIGQGYRMEDFIMERPI